MSQGDRLALRPNRDGGPVRALRDRGLVFAGLLTGYVLVCGGWFVALVAFGLEATARDDVTDAVVEAVRAQAVPLGLALVVATVGLFLLLGRGVGRYVLGVRRLSADVRVVTSANPAHRLTVAGPAELRELAADVNSLAAQREDAQARVAEQVAAAQAQTARERNRLATLMAELAVAVVVTNPEGRVLLYNGAARDLAGDESSLGLGRSVFALVDQDVVRHALAQLRERPRPVQVATARPDGRLVRARIAAVRDDDADVTGLILVLEDLTAAAGAADRRDALARVVSRTTRSAVANIRAAIETVLDYPDMAAQDREAFLRIVAQEASALGEHAQDWFTGSADDAPTAWLPADMHAGDVLVLLAGELAGAGYAVEVLVAADAVAPETSWLRVDGHSLGRAVVAAAQAAARDCAATGFELAYDERRGHAALDLRWAGTPAQLGRLPGWLEAPAGPPGSPTLAEVVDRHGGELWTAVGDDDVPYLRVLLPLVGTAPVDPVPATPATPAARTGAAASRPEFYDFDLFAIPEQVADLRHRRLDDLAFTVFDTETTGLDPDTDEIISVGAVHCVNGRVITSETYERLVDPGRRVPAASTAVHGITQAMVDGAPSIGDVLPELARFSADTVLVGHNVAFDLKFLRLEEATTGVVFRQPALDTMMLDAALHPDHETHTLEAMAARLGVDVVGRHTALGDALVTAEVFMGLVRLLREHGITTLGEAIDVSRATYLARVDRHWD